MFFFVILSSCRSTSVPPAAPAVPTIPAPATSPLPTDPPPPPSPAEAAEAAGVLSSNIPCETHDDCWVSDDEPNVPIARPAALKGRKFEPCEDGEHQPICFENRCALVSYGC